MLPWSTDLAQGKWSRFWSNYLGPGQLGKVKRRRRGTTWCRFNPFMVER